MKKSFVAALAVALVGAMTLAVASSASAPHKPANNIVQTAVAARSFETLVSPGAGLRTRVGHKERPRWAALPASVEPGLKNGDR